MFVLTSSSDCSVVLSDIHGNAYGTFGQPNQWRVDMDLTKLNEEDAQSVIVKDEDENSRKFDEPSRSTFSQDLDELSSMTDEEMLTRRSDVWESTSIGNDNRSASFGFDNMHRFLRKRRTNVRVDIIIGL